MQTQQGATLVDDDQQHESRYHQGHESTGPGTCCQAVDLIRSIPLASALVTFGGGLCCGALLTLLARRHRG